MRRAVKLTACPNHPHGVETIGEARAIVALICDTRMTARYRAEVAHAVTASSQSDCARASFARYLCSAAWRELPDHDDQPEYEPDDGEAQRIAETYADAAGELARDEAGEA